MVFVFTLWTESWCGGEGVRYCRMAGLHEHLWRAAESEWQCVILGHGGATRPPTVPLGTRGQDFIQDTGKWGLSLSVLKLPIFRAGFCRGHVGVCRAQASLAVNVNAHSRVQACFFWACFHCSEPLQPHPEQSSYPEQIAPSVRQQARSSCLCSAVCPCYGACLGAVIWGKNLLNWVLVKCYYILRNIKYIMFEVLR